MGVRPEQYKELIANDPGGDLQTAFDAMSAETVDNPKEISGNEMRIWAANFESDYTTLKADAATSVKAEVAVELIDDPNSVLDLSNPAVKAIFDTLNISAPAKAALEAMGVDSVAKYPYLKSAQVLQNARDIADKIANGQLVR